MTPRIYFPDTNAISKFLAGRDFGLCSRMREHLAQLRLSAVVWEELCYGAEKRRDWAELRIRLQTLRTRIRNVEPLNERAALFTARVRAYLANLKPNAQPIGYADCLLAGHALSLGATIITHNTREFARVPQLDVEDWQLA